MNLMELLPDYYRGNQTAEELQGILTEKINALAGDFNETIDQCFVNTATTLLSRYEKIYGLRVEVNRPNEFRRERIRAKIRGVGTTTKAMIKNVSESFSNGQVEVLERSGDYQFEIKFVGALGIPPNLDDLKDAVEDIKPAHLVVVYSFRYLTVNQVQAITLNELSTTKLSNFAPFAEIFS